jgi:hypothetical protein
VRLLILCFRQEVASSSNGSAEQMPHIPIVSSTPIAIQVVPKVIMLRDRMDMIIDHRKWTEKLICVYV